MRNTPLSTIHESLGAKMADFAGYNMPIVYTSIIEEHFAVRKSVGVFDVSHMGEFMVKGPEALNLVQKISSNDAFKLINGQAQYACLPNKTGGIVDDMLVYRLKTKEIDGEDEFMLVVNASNIEKDWNWIQENNEFDAQMSNISDDIGLLAVQGPKATELLQKLCSIDLSAIKYYHFAIGNLADIDNVIISATGYTGSGGFELYIAASETEKLWKTVFEAGKEFDIKACGLGARDTLRLEMGYCLYGNDIDDTTSPLEAGLGWITKLKKESDFNSKDIFLSQKQNGLERKLVGFTMSERRVPRHGYAIVDKEGMKIGEVTSGTQSPSLDAPIGMGYVNMEHSAPGSDIYIQMGKKALAGKVCALPFVKI
jgi:aminomethyltransferase